MKGGCDLVTYLKRNIKHISLYFSTINEVVVYLFILGYRTNKNRFCRMLRNSYFS